MGIRSVSPPSPSSLSPLLLPPSSGLASPRRRLDERTRAPSSRGWRAGLPPAISPKVTPRAPFKDAKSPPPSTQATRAEEREEPFELSLKSPRTSRAVKSVSRATAFATGGR